MHHSASGEMGGWGMGGFFIGRNNVQASLVFFYALQACAPNDAVLVFQTS